MSMLTDRAGCYNERAKKLVVRQLTSTVNSYGIAHLLRVRRRSTLFWFSQMYEYDFSRISYVYRHLCCNGLVFSLFMLLVTLKMLMDRVGCYNVRGKKIFLICRNNGF
ncbi:hypothetical protein HMPREF3191_01189 [Veillonellaceae bacterium DNF00626]|nr:hypothetical protein HMPREF3191_01189 [Veillonellaceae bacterium DNF00626]